MRLNKLFIQHFKKIDELKIDADGNNVEIRGKNGTGKTSVYDAYSWCLFGKGGTGTSIEGQIKRRDADGKSSDGGVEHTVEVELADDNGKTTVLSRGYHETWAKKRGQAQAEFTGHTTDYLVNGVPVQKKDFTEFVNGIASEEAFKLLSMPLHFCVGLHWMERRKLLLQVCGDISDHEVISSDQKLSTLPKLLDGKSIDDLRKIITAKRKEINQELQKIPARIDELSRQIPETDGIAAKEVIEVEIASLKKQQSDLERQILRIENGGEAAEKKKEIAKIEAEQTKIATKIEAEYASGTGKKERQLKDLKSEKSTIEKQLEMLKGRARIIKGSIDAANKKMNDLRQKYFERSQIEFISSVEDICPTCGQALPADKKSAAEAKALELFNLDRSSALADINAAGKEEKKRADADQKMFDEYQIDISKNESKLLELAEEIEKAAAEIGNCEKVNIMDDPTYQQFAAKKKDLLWEIDSIKNDAAAKIKKLQNEISIYNVDIALRQSKQAMIEQAKNMQERIKELKERESELGRQFSDIEQQLYMTEEFIRTKVALLEEKINGKFKHVKFKLFDQKINGGLEECCEAMIDGVPFSDGLNTGSKMKAGMDIVNVLSEYYGLCLPIFIDNCESYTGLIPTDSQTITLYADDNYDELEIKIKGE